MSSTNRPYVFFVQGHIFSSPNSSTIPLIPPQKPISSEDMRQPKECTKTRWADPRYPGFPFIPLRPRFTTEPFDCLRPPRDQFPIEGSKSAWKLAPATVKCLHIIENDLRLIEKILRLTVESPITLPSSWERLPLPTSFGYKAKHKTYQEALACAVKSRDAFLPLIGWCSFLMSHFHVQIPNRQIDILRWEQLLSQVKFSPDYIQVIKASELVDFSAKYPRSGVFIEHSDPHFQQYVCYYIRCNVPVWIHWGRVCNGPPNHLGCLNQYLPLDHEVAAVRAAAQQTHGAINFDQHPAESVGPANSELQFPEPEMHSRQKRGELWHEFFARMDKKRAAVIEKEDMQMKKARLAREKAQEGHPVPGLRSKAPNVYEWEEDEETGFLLRRAITRSHAQDIWESYSNTQRRYDSILHQWDLCTAMDPQDPKFDPSLYDSDDSEEICNLPKSVPFVIPDSIVSSTTRKLAPAVIPAPNTLGDIPLLPPIAPAPRDHTPPIESTSHYPAVLEPPSAQNKETMASSHSPPPILPHNDPPSSKSKGATSCSSVPLTDVTLAPVIVTHTLHDPVSAVATAELADTSPTISLLASAAPTDRIIFSDMLPPLVTTPTLPVPAVAAAESVLIPSITPLSASAAPTDGIAFSSVTPLPPTITPALHGPVPSMAAAESAPVPPIIPLSASSTSSDGIDSSVTPLPPMITLASKDPVLCTVTTELAAVPAPATENEGAAASSGKANRGTIEEDGEITAEPGRMHALIYDGLPAPLSPLSSTNTLLDVLYMRYGFIGAHGDKASQPSFAWPFIQKIFGDSESHVDNRLRAPVSCFLEGLLKPLPKDLPGLASLWDLATDSVLPLAEHINSIFRLHVCRSGPNVVYFIEVKNRTGDDVDWQLMLDDAASVLECFRQEQISSIRDLALFLLQRGMSFSTRMRRCQIQSPSPQHSQPLQVLGWRHLNYKPTIRDYNFYEHCRKAFFNNHPRSRSAYLRGGIIWRHALETAGALADESVLGGPSEETLTCGTCVQCDGVEPLWDDGLSEADIDVICGVYKYETGASVQCITCFPYSASVLLGNGNQTSDLSWWPKQSTFIRSGLWPGYWSRSCEDWYQHRHNDIVSGKTDLKTSAQWQKAMVLYQMITKLKKANSKAAALYIERHGTLLR